jgi:hypothetical protein
MILIIIIMTIPWPAATVAPRRVSWIFFYCHIMINIFMITLLIFYSHTIASIRAPRRRCRVIILLLSHNNNNNWNYYYFNHIMACRHPGTTQAVSGY